MSMTKAEAAAARGVRISGKCFTFTDGSKLYRDGSTKKPASDWQESHLGGRYGNKRSTSRHWTPGVGARMRYNGNGGYPTARRRMVG